MREEEKAMELKRPANDKVTSKNGGILDDVYVALAVIASTLVTATIWYFAGIYFGGS